MATLTLRNVKGSPLTYTELDDNVVNINDQVTGMDSAGWVRGHQDYAYASLTGSPTNLSDFDNDTNFLDSAAAILVIGGTVDGSVDSAYVQARQDYRYSSLTGVPTNLSDFNNDTNFLDSSAAILVIGGTIDGSVDSAYVQARQDYAYSSLTGAPSQVSDLTNDAGYIDSAGAYGAILDHVDEAYVRTRQDYSWSSITNKPGTGDLVNTGGYLDSTGVLAEINENVDSAYVQARQDFNYVSLYNKPTALSQFVNDLNFSSVDSSDVTDIVDASYIQSKTSIPTLTDVSITNLTQDEFLKWNGSAWVNQTVNLDGAVVFHGVVTVATDTAPSSPTNGDMYINDTQGTAGVSWTGIAGDTVDEGEAIVWSSDDSRWFSIGGVGNSGVVQVSGSPGITVVDSPDHQYISLQLDRSVLDTWYESDGQSVKLTGAQSIDGVKRFNDTISAGQSLVDTTMAIHTDGDIFIERSDGNPAELILHTDLNSGYQKLISKDDKLVLNMSSTTRAPTDRFFFTHTGEMGIGAATPTEKLDVRGNAYISGDLTVQGTINGGTY